MGRREGLLGDAIEHLSRRLQSDPWNDWLRYYLGNIYWWTDRERAIESYAEAARGFAERGDPIGELAARANLRRLLMQEGRIDEASLQVALAIASVRDATDPEVRAQVAILQARHLWQTSRDLGRAVHLLREAEELVFPEGSYDLQTDVLLLLGNVTLELGQLDRSIEHYQELARLVRKRSDDMLLPMVLHNIANAMRLQLEEKPNQRRRSEALTIAQEALERATRAELWQTQIMTYRLLGALLTTDKTRRNEAIGFFEQCLALAERFDFLQEKGNCQWEYARLLRPDDPDTARKLSDEALKIAREFGDPVYFAFAWRQRMRSAWAPGANLETSIAESLEALAAVEELRTQQYGEQHRAGLFSKWTADYHFVSGRLLEQGELLPAFQISERIRARTLHEATGTSAPVDLDAVQRQLSASEAVLAYQIGLWRDLYGEFGGGAWVIAITAAQTRAVPLPDRIRLDAAVDTFVGLLQRRDGAEVALAADLYELVIEDALEGLPSSIEKLVIIPDDVLYRLPFSALRDPRTKETLGSRFELSVVPSATLWHDLRHSTPAELEPAVLVYADPRTETGGEASEPGDDWAIVNTNHLERLPFARREGNSIRRRFAERGEIVIDSDASEAYLKDAQLHRFGILHFATHAIVDQDEPGRSAIVLSAGSNDQDGFLNPAEIESLELDGQLVALSACQTADGSLLRGEGVLSLARAFFRAGARAVVASLWPLRDEEAYRLFDSFYRRVAEGNTAAAALQGAQREALEEGLPAAAWSSLVLMGDGNMTPVPGGLEPGTRSQLGWSVLVLVLSAVVIALLIALKIRVRTRRGPA